ncbi:STAS domain-containing protein [Streptomyces sp. NPDC096012]|uniref:STAS domain-containing protein n=1 Tax=Streptomyces sp. NPDC096012 TaxID=3155684 RepID=UPI003369C3C0
MSQHQPSEFSLTVTTEPTTLTVYVAGELDYDTGDDLVTAFAGHLGRHPAPREVRLDFRHLTWIDSSGLAALLMIHRHAGAVGAELRLDNRPGFLDDRLRLTNVFEHLVGPGRFSDPGASRADGDATRLGVT